MTWDKVKLGDLAMMYNGGTPDRANDAFYAGNIPWITGADLKDGEVDGVRLYITEDAVRSSATRRMPKGSLLFISRTGVGKVAIAPFDVCISQDFTGIVPDGSRINTRYLLHYIKASKRYFTDRARGATIQGVTRDVVAKFEIPLPPLAIQQRIAAVLDEVDALRQKREQSFELLRTLRASKFNSVFGEIVNNPMNHPIKLLPEVLLNDFTNGIYYPKEKYTEDSSGTEMVHMSDAFNGVVQRGNLRRVISSSKDITKYGLSSEDILIARRSLNYEGAAKPCRIPVSAEPLLFESSFIRISPNLSLLSTNFLYEYLCNPFTRTTIIEPRINKATISGINQAALSTIPVMIPPLELQNVFDLYSDEINEQTTRISNQNARLSSLAISLTNNIFSGEFALRDLEAVL